ncbi:probable CCR4-associated factor 1 homolog 11 [Momordica charantia]|uniref:poly(A)-specific ribonuclease n=1 Tax=Momordica charantia TaxID=3673 RepID=A0A6J1BSV0_MOMCH|nr:probable CCR4-associated factor 1 homolog 11 [Momordica charantia]
MSNSKSLPPVRSIVTRSVWSNNLESEFELIRSIIHEFPLISMDTEFPGVVIHSDPADPKIRRTRLETNYFVLKANVDRLKLIQVGLTLADEEGNLPDLGTNNVYIWEFNFRDFDVAHDPYADSSIVLLKRQGIDFEYNRDNGIDSVRFAQLLMGSGLVCSDCISWVTFHSAYDFGYLVKILTRRALPEDLLGFLNYVRLFFGPMVFDVKYLMKYCPNLHGGLDRVCEILNVDREIGKSHQAGSDSLVTLRAFRKMREVYFSNTSLEVYAGVLFGLEIQSS